MGEDQFLSKKEWLRMHGTTDDSFILAACVGADAYKMEINRLAQEASKKEKKEKKS